MTAYTAFIEDGSVTTGKDFLKLCSRQFGVYATSKDEPLSPDIPTTIVKDPKFQQAVDTAKATLDTALHCDDWETELANKKTAISNQIETIDERFEELTEAYNTISQDIATYKPDDPYEKIKEFALNQIKISLKVIPTSELLKKELEKLETYEADEYKDIVIKKLSEELAARIVENMKEDQNVAKRQEYLDKFWESIQDM